MNGALVWIRHALWTKQRSYGSWYTVVLIINKEATTLTILIAF